MRITIQDATGKSIAFETSHEVIHLKFEGNHYAIFCEEWEIVGNIGEGKHIFRTKTFNTKIAK